MKSYLISSTHTNKKTLTLIFYLLFSSISFTQFDDEIIAKFGNISITKDEFIERYEFTPQLYASVLGAEESLKKEFLYSLIAEKIWALEAESIGLDKSELITSTYKAIEKMYVRDALYRVEILSKVNLSDEYLSEAYRRSGQLLNLNYIFSENYKKIDSIYQQLISGVNFYSIMLQRPESKLQEAPYVVTYGKMDKNVEDKLYSLKPGEITEPVKAPNGWYVFKLLSIQQRTVENIEQAKAEEKYILKVAEQTITDSIYKDFYSELFKNVKVETNKELLTLLSDLIVSALNNRKEKENLSGNDKIYLTSDDLYDIEADLGEKNLNAVFIKLDEEPETLNDFLQELSIEKFYVDSLDVVHIKGRINFYVKTFIEHELFAREGYRRGLQNLPEVKKYLNIWKSYYLSEVLRKEILDSITVTEEEINKYYSGTDQENPFPVEVKVIELLTQDLDIINKVLKDLENGSDFKQLAVEYTIREEARRNDGELGYFSSNQYGEIGRKAATMRIGEMYGPIKVPEGYSLFELIDKKDMTQFPESNFEAERNRIMDELTNKKYSDAIINKTVELVDKYDLDINEEVINSIKVLNTTTVIYRHFGFGGKLLAVPMTEPNYLWVKPWQEQTVIAP